MSHISFTPRTFNEGQVDRHPAKAGLKKVSMQKLPPAYRNFSVGRAVMASGHGLPARVHFVNANAVSAQSDFSRAVVQTMAILHPLRP